LSFRRQRASILFSHARHATTLPSECHLYYAPISNCGTLFFPWTATSVPRGNSQNTSPECADNYNRRINDFLAVSRPVYKCVQESLRISGNGGASVRISADGQAQRLQAFEPGLRGDGNFTLLYTHT